MEADHPVRGGDEEDSSEPPIEAHPLNPAATRRPGGFWNEDTLPVLEWEAPEHRVVVPEDIQRRHGVPTPVLRFARSKRETIMRQRPIFRRHVERLGDYLAGVTRTGNVPPPSMDVELLFSEHGRWHTIAIGPDRNGSWNVITVTPMRPEQSDARLKQPWIEERGVE